jgi:L-galactose dehydrogenase
LKYRVLGKTGLRVSALGLGASALGGGVFGPVDERDAIQTVHTALDLGINLIDVAPFYGATRAEAVLGKALQGIPRDRYILATKVGRYGPVEFDFSAARTAISINESLRRLGTAYVDLIQSHDNEYANLDQVVDETIPALRGAQDAGKARFVGATGYPLKIFRAILDRTELDTVLSYNHYSLNDTTLTGLLADLESKNVGIISAAPVSQGLLTNERLPDWHPAPADVKETCAQAARYCRNQGCDIAKLAIQFAIDNPRIHTIVVGATSADMVSRNVAWISQPIDQELLDQVRKILAPIKDRTWKLGRSENN